MKRACAALVVSAVAAAGLVPAAAAAPLSKASLWDSPSARVACAVEIHAVDIHARTKPPTQVLCAARGIPAPRRPGAGNAWFVQMGLLGTPRVILRTRNSFVAGRIPVTLGRGRLWNQLGVTCHVAQTTVLCFNGDNHGFVIGDGRYRSF